jgi:uncharacterized protein (TIGR03083 family)
MSEIREQIAEERRELAAVLAGLPADAWDADSLCAGWRVREVVAHMTMAFRYSAPKVIFGLVRARGGFDRMLDRAARRDTAALSAEELTAVLRDNAEHPWKPPRGGYGGALTHDVVHGLDVTVPLGLDRKIPEERLRLVLGGLASERGLKWFGVDLNGVELRADDIDWSYGSGEPVTGAAQDLAVLLCGRRLPPDRLTGEPAARFTRQG